MLEAKKQCGAKWSVRRVPKGRCWPIDRFVGKYQCFKSDESSYRKQVEKVGVVWEKLCRLKMS